MRDLWVVASFTIKEMLKKKTFLISNLILIIIMIVGFNIPNIIKALSDGKDDNSSKMLIVDSENVFEGTLAQLEQMKLEYAIETTNDNISFEDIKKKIENKEIEDAIIIKKSDGKINLEYIVQNLNMKAEPTNCINALTAIYSNLQLSKLGLTQSELASLNPNFNLEMKQTEEQEVKGNVLAIMLLSIVLFYAIYFCAYQVSTSITTEKTSKIIETLVTSTTPKTIVLGKTVGVGIVGIIQIVVLVSVALICANVCLPAGTLDGIIDLSTVTPFLGIMTIIYFLLGYLVYALLYALTGSTVSKPEDVQSANGPVAILAVIGFYLAYFTMMNPTSDLNTFASIFPFSSPFCVPFRIMMGVATPTQIAISLAVLVITMLIIAKISIKIYSSAILNYGSKIGIKDIINIYKNKENNN